MSTFSFTAEDDGYAESESASSVVLIVAVLVGVLGTAAIGLIIAVVILSRRRSSSERGVSLIVSDEM